MPAFPTIKLQNGVELPIIGLGTWQSTDDDVRKAVEVAIEEAHYPLIDTAECYQNEEVIGNALHKLISDGKIKREDVFITTKLWTNNLNPARSLAATRECLKRLQLEKVDLLLCHMPAASEASGVEHEKDVSVEDVWRGMEAIYDAGLARAIGVSNWSVEQIERVMKTAKTPIHNVQNELYLYWPQHELEEVCKKYGISITSYGSLGSPGRVNFTLPTGQKLDWAAAPNALDDSKVKELAEKYKKSPAQVLLRYVIERGIAVIPKSVTPSRIHENLNVFDFKLTEEEVKSLDSVPHRQRLFLQPFMEGHPEDPFKSERV
ncbi:hypothetical protein PMAYCL1PPCAC_02340 [Pristionchus mayeri]|uniref:NADP-dependent oxidoreductase domain-containing protein n=1 Tax=Pristionchus mayeri TaxID=1317129 RepID=A0AAN4Z7X7_9BILA|nr:hypothetical protein PMAYCL1PPCAC_02340 [Pristionchus mayeri]